MKSEVSTERFRISVMEGAGCHLFRWIQVQFFILLFLNLVLRDVQCPLCKELKESTGYLLFVLQTHYSSLPFCFLNQEMELMDCISEALTYSPASGQGNGEPSRKWGGRMLQSEYFSARAPTANKGTSLSQIIFFYTTLSFSFLETISSFISLGKFSSIRSVQSLSGNCQSSLQPQESCTLDLHHNSWSSLQTQ